MIHPWLSRINIIMNAMIHENAGDLNQFTENVTHACHVDQKTCPHQRGTTKINLNKSLNLCTRNIQTNLTRKKQKPRIDISIRNFEVQK